MVGPRAFVGWIDPLLFSLKLGLAAGACSTLLALPLAFALVRHDFRGRTALLALTLGPLLLPALVTGAGLLQSFQYVGLRNSIGLPALLCGHVVICLPFAVRTIAISLQNLPPNLEHAAASLGAPPWRVQAHVDPAADQERHRGRSACLPSFIRSPTSTCRCSWRGREKFRST